MVRIGTAGWAIPKPHAEAFAGAGSHLQRYAERLAAVEINSSFYRPHRPATYARWAAGVPAWFRFAVKVPREITHVRKLRDAGDLLDRFVAEVAALGERLGPLLVQLPPSLWFDSGVAGAFWAVFRDRFEGLAVCEPRHPSWFTDDADAMLRGFRIARVAADPAPVPGAGVPGGWPGLAYYRLHGSPRMYYSDYAGDYLATLAETLHGAGGERWCIFDNTALGYATGNALGLVQRLKGGGAPMRAG